MEASAFSVKVSLGLSDFAYIVQWSERERENEKKYKYSERERERERERKYKYSERERKRERERLPNKLGPSTFKVNPVSVEGQIGCEE
jgi:hypothetical protein